MDRGRPILIAACGNAMAGDDAFGPVVASRLRDKAPPGAEVVLLDMRPAGLLDELSGRTALIVVDAVWSRRAPAGWMVDVDWFAPDRPALADDDVLSTHGLSIGEQLKIARQLRMLPAQVRLIGVTIRRIDVGNAMSDVVRAQVEPVVRRIVDLVRRWHGVAAETSLNV